MDERALTQLAYLVQSLLRGGSKEDFAKVLAQVESLNGPFAPEVQKALEVLKKSLPTGSLDEEALQKLATRLIRDGGSAEQNAGRAIAWALERESLSRVAS